MTRTRKGGRACGCWGIIALAIIFLVACWFSAQVLRESLRMILTAEPGAQITADYFDGLDYDPAAAAADPDYGLQWCEDHHRPGAPCWAQTKIDLERNLISLSQSSPVQFALDAGHAITGLFKPRTNETEK